MKVDFITFCHPGDIHRLYQPGWLKRIVNSHKYPFDRIIVIHQRCDTRGHRLQLPNISVSSKSHPNILSEFGLLENDSMADEYTHGPTAAHYWKWHVINHLIGLKVSSADYIVFSDNDCLIRSFDSDYNWIKRGIEILEKYPQVLIVSPGDGAVMTEALTEEGYRLTQNVSQQLFLCNRQELADIDFDLSWDWEYLAPGGPMQEYYYMLEGRIWRYLHKHNLWRCILPDYVARYWHCNKLTDEGYFESDFSKY